MTTAMIPTMPNLLTVPIIMRGRSVENSIRFGFFNKNIFFHAFIGMGVADWILFACSSHLCREKQLPARNNYWNLLHFNGAFARNRIITLARFARINKRDWFLLFWLVSNASMEHGYSLRSARSFEQN